MTVDDAFLEGLSLYQHPDLAPWRPFSPLARKTVAAIVLETTSEGVWLIDAESRTSFASRVTAELLGYTEAEMTGRHLFDFMDDEGRRICEQNLSRRKSGVAEHHEFKFVRKDGVPVWTMLATNPVYDHAGAYAGALAMLSDITDRKAAEIATADRLRQLESLLSQRTSERDQALARANELQSVAHRDPQTGLYNRAYLNQHLDAEIKRTLPRHARFCVLLFQIDGLSKLIETVGFATAEVFLKSLGGMMGSTEQGIASAWRNLLPEQDFGVRMGSDEFLIVAPSTSLDAGLNLAEHVLKCIGDLSIEFACTDAAMKLNAGVAAYPWHAGDRDSLLGVAYKALFEARRRGRGTACIGLIK
jgi:diguanylate cyclase (GGDEF)-like protein/PAS domain S-box-containing protein